MALLAATFWGRFDGWQRDRPLEVGIAARTRTFPEHRFSLWEGKRLDYQVGEIRMPIGCAAEIADGGFR